VISRFESKFVPEPNSGCYLWIAAAGKRYGHFGLHGKVVDAHRASYELYVSKIPEGKCVLHSCDVPLCVNPAHLFLGTQTENLDDMTKKGRRSCGRLDGHGSAKLTIDQVMAIRADNRKHAEIAKEYGIGQSTVGSIKTGVTWKLDGRV
jgi:hypothetical protein